jgi:hypothetical protein
LRRALGGVRRVVNHAAFLKHSTSSRGVGGGFTTRRLNVLELAALQVRYGAAFPAAATRPLDERWRVLVE